MDDFITKAMQLADEMADAAVDLGASGEVDGSLNTARAALLAHMEGGRADAERYRWLRDYSTPAIFAFYLSVGKAFDGVKFARETVDEAIDAQIDAARASDALKGE